jgi:RNA polymerase sigma factor (sigma-70 family)
MLNNTNTEATTLSTMLASTELHKRMARAVERAIGRTSATGDIVQSALINMIEASESFDASKGSISNWGCRIAANLARNWRKASANRGHESEHTTHDNHGESTTVDLVDTLVSEDGRAEVSRRSDAMALARAIATLDDDAQTFLACLADGMGQTEAGKVVGWSPATTTRRYRAIVEDLACEMV